MENYDTNAEVCPEGRVMERWKLARSEDWQQETDGQEEKGNMTRMCSYAKISKGGAESADELWNTGNLILCIIQLSKY